MGFHIFPHIPDVLLDLCGAVEIIRFCFPVLQYPPLGKNGKHIFTNLSPYGAIYSSGQTQRLPAERKEVSFKAISFFSFIFSTAFYLPLVHTMEAIVVFPAAKTGHKVLSNLCHMARLCFALPTASPLKTLRPL